MKKLWKILLPVLVMCVCFLLLPAKASAATVVSSGTCGTNLTWTLDDEGTLTISGTGGMNYYASDTTPFRINSNIKAVVIENGVTSIGSWAFYGCSNLTSVTISNSVTSIGDSAFYNCSSLTGVTIPDSVTSIGEDAFYGCSELKRIYLSNLSVWMNITFSSGSDNPLSSGARLYLNGKVLTNITVPDGITTIKPYVFYGYTNLKTITIPDSVTSIGQDAFRNCSSLTSATISDSVTSIGDHAFYWCSSLTSITIPDSVTSIGNYAFSGCSSLTDIYIADVAAWLNIKFGSSGSNPLYSNYKKNLYLNGELITDLILPDEVTAIPDYAFTSVPAFKALQFRMG